MAQLIKVFEYISGAGQTKTLPGGRFFRLLKATAVVDVEFFADSGDSLGKAEGILAGLALSIEPSDIGKQARLIGFSKVQVTSATAQTIQVAIGRQRVEYDRSAGSVDATIVGQPISVSAKYQWEGRSPVYKRLRYNSGGGIAPHVATTRWTYTVPALKLLVVHAIHLQTTRITAAAPAGYVRNSIFVDGSEQFSCIIIGNAVGEHREIMVPQFFVEAGKIIYGYTADPSTGGTVDYTLSITGVEIDA